MMAAVARRTLPPPALAVPHLCCQGIAKPSMRQGNVGVGPPALSARRPASLKGSSAVRLPTAS